MWCLESCQCSCNSLLSQLDILFWGSERERLAACDATFKTKDFAGNRNWKCNYLLDLFSHQTHSVSNFIKLLINTS